MLNPGFNGVLGQGYHIHRGWPMEHWQKLIGIITGPYLSVTPGKVLSSDIECQPCYCTDLRKTCKFNRCMVELLPEEVSAALGELLGNL